MPGANGANAPAEIVCLVAAGRRRVPVAASFPVEQIRRAAELQAGRHVHGKVVADLWDEAWEGTPRRRWGRVYPERR